MTKQPFDRNYVLTEISKCEYEIAGKQSVVSYLKWILQNIEFEEDKNVVAK